MTLPTARMEPVLRYPWQLIGAATRQLGLNHRFLTTNLRKTMYTPGYQEKSGGNELQFSACCLDY